MMLAETLRRRMSTDTREGLALAAYSLGLAMAKHMSSGNVLNLEGMTDTLIDVSEAG